MRWYERHARELPWRVGPAGRKKNIKPNPYHVWLSEIMLQQTTVATVTPRFKKFLARWPDLSALAAATQEAVLAEWAGLGYYARARNLHKCAQELTANHASVFPETARELESLPGIGPYTAAAIAAIAYDEAAVVMDGNIERVMARLFAVVTPLPDAKPFLRDHAASQTPAKRVGDHAQALMDLGATICTPRNPTCILCPLNELCAAYKQGLTADLPRKKKKSPKPTRYGTAFVIRRKSDGAVLLIRRPEKGLLGGMLAPPSTDWTENKQQKPASPISAKWKKSNRKVMHTFTHFHLIMEIRQTEVSDQTVTCFKGEWVKDPAKAGLPTVFRKVFTKP